MIQNGYGRVIYLTGAPAAGKSTLARKLKEMSPQIEIFEYGKKMADYLSASGKNVGQNKLRGGTGPHVSAEAIEHIDSELVEWVDRERLHRHLIIDSHQVTIESHGFRIVPFSSSNLTKLHVDEIWIVITDSVTTRNRIATKADGRLEPTSFMADFHTYSQTSLALSYGAIWNCPTYVFDGSMKRNEIVDEALKKIFS